MNSGPLCALISCCDRLITGHSRKIVVEEASDYESVIKLTERLFDGSLFCFIFQEIYALGGRTFWVLNLAPIGCYPAFLVQLPHNTSDIDQFGCLISYNNAVVDYNNMLKAALAKTRKELADANVVYVDTHTVLLELFQHPTSHGTTCFCFLLR